MPLAALPLPTTTPEPWFFSFSVSDFLKTEKEN
jgi:hypothetical protein